MMSTTSVVARPSNAAVLGKFTRNPIKGTGQLVVSVPGPGALVLTGPGVKKTTAEAATAGRVRLLVRTVGKAKRRLDAKGRTTVKVKILFQPNGGDPASQSRTLSLRRIEPS